MEKIAFFAYLVVIMVALGALFSLPVWWLWNSCLVGAVAGVQPVTWLQAWGITALCGMLFNNKMGE